MTDVNTAITLLKNNLERFSDFEWDLSPQPLRYQCNAHPTELSKPQESVGYGSKFRFKVWKLFHVIFTTILQNAK